MSKTVLIVDDAYFMRNLLKKALKEAGHEVIGEAKNGKEGIKFYFELKPDFVTMDINMPDMSGIETTKQIMSKDPNAKIIAVTGNNDDEIKQQILDAGASEYLQKPFQPAFLWSKVDKMLEKAEEVVLKEKSSPLVEVAPSVIAHSVITEDEAVEDNFDEMEIEIMDKPDESKSMTFLIENEEDSIEFPDEYKGVVVEEQVAFSLTKENLKNLEEEEFIIEAEDVPILIELEDYEPVVEESIPKIPTPASKPIPKPVVKPKQPYSPNGGSPIQPHPSPKETVVSTVEITKSKKSNRKIEEINIRPQGMYDSSGKEVNIRPPRGKLLREEPDEFNKDEVEEPILNVSDKDNYNKDTNEGIVGLFKKLFKK